MTPLRMFALATLLILTQQAPQNGSVEIRVLDSLTHKGIPAVRITLVYFAPEPPNDVKVLFTDAEGRVVARNLPVGNYVARMEREGYRPPVRIPGADDGSSLSFSIRPERPDHKSEVEYVPLGTVSGRVEYPNGDPFPRASVALLTRAYQNGFPTFSTNSETVTDDGGLFRLTAVSPGDYYILVRHSLTGSLPGVTYYPGVTDSVTAAPVPVRGNDISISVRLPRQPVFKISGTVISSTAMVGGGVSLMSANSASLEARLSPTYVRVNPNELFFELNGVSPGDYFLFPQVTFSGSGVTRESRTLTNKVAVTVFDRDIESLRITMQLSLALKGTVIVSGDASGVQLESLKVATQLREISPAALLITRDVVGVPVSRLGEFVLENLTPDVRYALRVPGLPPDAYVSDIRQGGRSVYAEGFIKAGSSDAAIEIRVDTRGGTIAGSVRDVSNQAATQTTVVVVPDAPRRANPLLYKRIVTDATGAFTLRGVAPGEYQLFAWAVAPPQGAEEDARFLAPYEGKGTIVRVSLSTQTTAQLRLLPQ